MSLYYFMYSWMKCNFRIVYRRWKRKGRNWWAYKPLFPFHQNEQTKPNLPKFTFSFHTYPCLYLRIVSESFYESTCLFSTNAERRIALMSYKSCNKEFGDVSTSGTFLQKDIKTHMKHFICFQGMRESPVFSNFAAKVPQVSVIDTHAQWNTTAFSLGRHH